MSNLFIILTIFLQGFFQTWDISSCRFSFLTSKITPTFEQFSYEKNVQPLSDAWYVYEEEGAGYAVAKWGNLEGVLGYDIYEVLCNQKVSDSLLEEREGANYFVLIFATVVPIFITISLIFKQRKMDTHLPRVPIFPTNPVEVAE